MIKQKFLRFTGGDLAKRISLVLIAAVSAAMLPLSSVRADQFDDQINALQSEVNQYQAEAGRLRAQANTLQNEINAINAEKSALQTQIDLNTAKMEQLNAQIQESERKLQEQRENLAVNLRSMYLESGISPLEMVASSKNLSDFIDRQEYRNKIRDKVQKNLVSIRKTKDELTQQKLALEQTLKDQEAQREQLAAKEAAQSQLLAETQGQEESFQQLTGQRNARIAELRAQQAAQNVAKGGKATYGASCGGGYSGPWPHWCNGSLDQYVDQWGMYTRECVSYTAFKVWQSGRHMPYWGGRGNAHQWDDNARAAGMPVDTNPRVGDVVVWHIDYYGHVMYVDSVLGDGSIVISEYNYDWTGRYSQRVISPSQQRAQGLVFIHFP